jgi:hypothetical protein
MRNAQVGSEQNKSIHGAVIIDTHTHTHTHTHNTTDPPIHTNQSCLFYCCFVVVGYYFDARFAWFKLVGG